MKNKPVRHKETNTFKFKKFSERISEIDVDVFHRVVHRNEEASDDEETLETNFHKTLQKWNVLNLTESYKSFRKEVQHVVTLPQLLVHKQEVLDSLTKYLRMKNVTFVHPVLDLVVAAAKDLQKDFYEHFPHFLSLIIDLLSTKDPEILEYSFTTLAYLFKFLWRYLIKNIDRTFELLLPLLVDTKPEYVNNFAAESFAFVARKVRDREAFLILVFEALEKTPDGTVGCGKLLFEVISGISGQFHSCAEQMLTLYLNSLINDSMNEELVFKVVEQVFICITNSINPRYSQILWSVVFKFLDEYSIGENGNNEKIITSVLKLCRLIVEHKGGRMMIVPLEMKSRLVKIIPLYDNEILKETVDLSIDILLANNLKLTQEISSEFVAKLLSIKQREMLNYIVEKLVDHSSFETLILPMALQRSVLREKFESNELKLFSKVVNTRAPPSLNGINSKHWRKINLDLRGFPSTSVDFINEKLQNWEEDNSVSEDGLRAVIILPHVTPVRDNLMDQLKKNLISMYYALSGEDFNNFSTPEMEKRCFTFLLTLESITHLSEIEDFQKFIEESKIDFLELIKKYPSVPSILDSADLFFTLIATSEDKNLYLNEKIFDGINAHLSAQLGSPYGKIRLTVAHIYSLFSEVQELFIEKNDEGLNALSLPFAAESVETTVYNYRDRLIHLQALTFDSRSVMNLKPKYYDFPVRFLIGNLYINFSLLWDPTGKAIATYATDKCPQFWPIFLEQLKKENPLSSSGITERNFTCEVLKDLIKKSSLTDKPDHQNYKILLWKCMSEFPDFIEVKNRDVTVLFIDFVENKIFKSNTETSRSYNISKRESSQEVSILDQNDSEDEENANKEETSKKFLNKKLGKTSDFKLLLAQLNLFSKTHNPKMMYREPEMYQIYLDLLTSKSVELQKAVLDCLSAYKHKYLTPYKDHLYGLIEEKNLRNELARFKIEHEEGTTGMIQSDHRQHFMPILMRLIYAKMISKGTGRAAGAAGGLVRRKIILRFLMGVKEDEMMLFTKMAFKPFEKYQISLSPEDELKDLKQLTTEVMKNLDLSDVIPPKRLRSAVNLLSIIIEEFGAKMSQNLLPRLLALLLCIMAQIKGIIEQSENVLSAFIPIIKDLKNTCIGILARFFGHFEDYNWSETELDVLFDVAVFPWIEKLPVEGVHSPTALLKLLSAWCQNPRYFCLLLKHKEDDPTISCLPFIIKLFLGNKTHPSVNNTILDMLEKLLTLQDYGVVTGDAMEIDEQVKIPLTPRNLLQVNAASLLPGVHINYGSSILLPHVPDILDYIKRKFQKSKYGVNRTETSILARISELNLDPVTSDSLVSLSLPILVKRAMKGEAEETILELLTTIWNLMKNVQDPHVHLRAILPLFSCVSSSSGRKLVLKLFKTIASKESKSSGVSREIMMKTSDLLANLNATDSRWIDNPDFDKRLDAFSEIRALINPDGGEMSDVLTIEFGVAVLYCCFYFIKHEKDLSLRACAGQCLNMLGPVLAKKSKENKVDRVFLVEETILNLTRNGIRSMIKEVRDCSISFLGAMSMECPDVHPVFKDLNRLTDKIDPEVDFFENLQHLQLHRRSRAFLRFCDMSETLERPPNSKTLTQFIFPLASSYLCNQSFANKNSLVDSAIKTVGAVCRLLPWHQYSIILKYYLDKLRSSTEFQRQIVRTVIGILEAFHYDLSKLKGVEDVIENAQEECKESQEISGVPVEPEADKPEDLVPQVDEEPEEALNEALNKEEDSPEEEDEKIPEDKKESIKFIQKQTVLSPYAAKGLVFDITKTYLPQLQRSILSRTHHEMSHKVNRKRTGSEKEEEELMRVPIALALVKLLQKLPEKILDKNLPGIFMKLCTFLKSRLESVRRATREILQKIMITLGPDYLHHLLREMNSLLTRGFEIHVLAYTIHAVLICLKPFFQEKHMNENLQSILQVCKVDLFGLTAEEKEVHAVTKSTSEAKSTKSFDIFHVLGQFITESCLIDLLQPLVSVLNDARSHKTVRKVMECLRHVVLGLADNNFIQPDKILIFLYGVVSKSIPSLSPNKPKNPEQKQKIKTQVSDCFIIPAEPKSRMGVKAIAKTSGDTNDHVLLEFALKLLHVLLKREKVSRGAFRHYLEPFVAILSDCLESQHVTLSTLALQCLNWVIKMDLESVRASINQICASIFKILHKYGAAGLGKGDNFDLVMAAFKTMSVLVRDVKHFNMSDDQVKALILYAEQDLHDYERQSTAFNLLKAIVNRKLIIPEMHEVMKKVSALSVTSESESVRQQSRNVFYAFLMEYPLGKDLEKHLSFYLSQLSYEVQSGRMSALNMIFSIVVGFPEAILVEQSGLMFIMVGARLVNDEDPECKKLSAKILKEIITRVPHNQRVKLFDIVMTWFKSPKVSLRRLAAQLCGVFVTVEKDSFETRLDDVLPLVLKQFRPDDVEENKPGQFVKRKMKKIVEDDVKDPERLRDHHLFQVLQLTLKISANCSAFLKSGKYIETVQSLAEYSQSHLGYPHLWVRLAATQQIGFVLATLDEDKLSRYLQFKTMENEEEIIDKGYVYSSPVETLRSLSLDLLAQLQPGMEFEELGDQVVKNLVFIARVIKTSCWGKEEGNDQGISLLWLVKRVRRCVNMEVTQNPKSTCVRSAAFKWTAGVVTTIPMDPYLKPILFQLMSPLVREMMTTEESNAPLRQLSKEVGRMIKKRIDDDEYAKLLSRVQQKLDVKRAERKKTQKQQYVIDPESAAKKSIAKQQKKKMAKKRKKMEIQGKRKGAKRPRRDNDVEIT